MRVVAITGRLIPELQFLWQSIANFEDVDLHLVGTLENPNDAGFGWETAEIKGLRTHALSLSGPRVLLSRGQQWWWLRGLRDVVSQVRPNLIHCQGEVWSLTVTQALALGVPSVGHSWDNLFRHGSLVEDAIRRSVARRNLARFRGYVGGNSRNLLLAYEHGLPPEAPTDVAPLVVPGYVHFNTPVPDRTGPLRICYLGRLVPEKGVDVLLRAVRELRDRATARNFKVSVVGAGPMAQSLRSYAAANSLEVDFEAPIHLSAVPALLRTMDVLVVPSRATPGWEEQFGKVVVEGMLSGCTVVVTDAGALREVVGKHGLAVPSGDAQELASALARLLEDPESTRAMGRQARQDAERRFSPSVIGARIVHVWNRVLGGDQA